MPRQERSQGCCLCSYRPDSSILACAHARLGALLLSAARLGCRLLPPMRHLPQRPQTGGESGTFFSYLPPPPSGTSLASPSPPVAWSARSSTAPMLAPAPPPPPQNTLLDGSAAPRLKICDFGYSKSSFIHSVPKSTVGALAAALRARSLFFSRSPPGARSDLNEAPVPCPPLCVTVLSNRFQGRRPTSPRRSCPGRNTTGRRPTCGARAAAAGCCPLARSPLPFSMSAPTHTLPALLPCQPRAPPACALPTTHLLRLSPHPLLSTFSR